MIGENRVSTVEAPATTQSERAQTVSPMYVSSDAVQQILQWDEMIGRLRAVYSVPLDDKCSPPRTVARGDRNWIRTLTSVPPGSRYMGAKIFGMARNRNVAYMIALMDRETGGFVGMIDAYYVTSFRTGATSAVAVDRICTAGAKSMAVLGSGSEASAHVRAIAAVRPISALRVYSPTAANCAAFAARMQLELGIPSIAMASPEAAVDGADIVVACARSRGEKPTIYGSWLRPGMVVVSIGSTLPEQREIDASVVDVCDLIVCDMVEEVVDETGDMIAAKAAGIDFRGKLGSLNDLMTGKLDARVAAARLPMFKSVGAALQDIVIAELVLECALERGLATLLPAEFQIRRTGKKPQGA